MPAMPAGGGSLAPRPSVVLGMVDWLGRRRPSRPSDVYGRLRTEGPTPPPPLLLDRSLRLRPNFAAQPASFGIPGSRLRRSFRPAGVAHFFRATGRTAATACATLATTVFSGGGDNDDDDRTGGWSKEERKGAGAATRRGPITLSTDGGYHVAEAGGQTLDKNSIKSILYGAPRRRRRLGQRRTTRQTAAAG
uniref:Uncharacterized protein n=1 Tax=Plectus sambesii TaxID=2011161 RepID=A0A914WUV9_9BILA